MRKFARSKNFISLSSRSRTKIKIAKVFATYFTRLKLSKREYKKMRIHLYMILEET